MSIHFIKKKICELKYSLGSNSYLYFCAFVLPFSILLMVFIKQEIFPFGDSTVMTRALFDDFVPFYSEFQRKIFQSESLFYSWNIAGGINFWAVIGSYISSPFNLLLLPFPQTLLPLGLTILFFLRISLSGLFFAVFINNKEPKLSPIFVLVLSTAYSLCGYSMAFFWAFMWLDAFVLLPLIILGVYHIIEGKRISLFTITLSVVFLSHYVMGAIVLFFSLCVAIIFSFENSEKFKNRRVLLKSLFRVFLSGLISIGMAAFFVFPTIRAISQSHVADAVDYTSDLVSELTLFDVGTRLFYGSAPVLDSKAPNIYISMGVLFLVPLFFLCSKIKLAERLVTLFVVLMLYAVMTSRLINYFIDGRLFIDNNHYKYSFLLSFLLIYVGARVAVHFRDIPRKHITGVLVGFLIYIMLFNQTAETKPDLKNIFLIILFVVLSSILWGLLSNQNQKKLAISLLFLAFMIVDFISSSYGAISSLNSNEPFQSYSSYRQHIEFFEKNENSHQNLGRSAFVNSYSKNDGALFGVQDIGGSYDLQNRGFKEYMSFLGILDLDNQFDPHSISIFSINFLNIESLYTKNPNMIYGRLPINNYIEFIYDDLDNEDVFQNYELSKNGVWGILIENRGVAVLLPDSQNIMDNWESWLEYIGFDYYYLQQDIGEDLGWGSNIKYDIDYGIAYSSYINSSIIQLNFEDFHDVGLLYIHTFSPTVIQIRNLDGDGSPLLFRERKVNGDAIIDSLYPEFQNDNVVVKIISDHLADQGVKLSLLALNQEAYYNFASDFENKGFIPSIWSGNIIDGHVQSNQEEVLVLFVPYDMGWSATVNGENRSVSRAFGSLLSIPMDAGDNNIELKYVPPGLGIGVFLSGQAVLVFMLLLIFNPFGLYSDFTKTKKSRLKNRFQEAPPILSTNAERGSSNE